MANAQKENKKIAAAAKGQQEARRTKRVSTATGEKAAAAPKASKAPKASGNGTQADKVRAMFTKNPEAKPSEVAKATGVNPAYVWDIRAAMQRKAAKEAAAATSAE